MIFDHVFDLLFEIWRTNEHWEDETFGSTQHMLSTIQWQFSGNPWVSSVFDINTGRIMWVVKNCFGFFGPNTSDRNTLLWLKIYKDNCLFVCGIKVKILKLKINKYFIWINMHYIEPYIDLFWCKLISLKEILFWLGISCYHLYYLQMLQKCMLTRLFFLGLKIYSWMSFKRSRR